LVHLCKSAESNGLVKSSDAVVSAPNSDHLQRFLGCIHIYVALPAGPLLQLLPKTYFCATTWSFVERKDKPRRATDSIRFTLARLSPWFDWRNALIAVKPATLSRWHRTGSCLFWEWKSRPSGRPCVPVQLRKLIVEMATNKSDLA